MSKQLLTLSKKQLASLLNVSSWTIGVWLNHRYYEDLKKLGYIKSQKILLPKQVEYIVGKLDIDINDTL